MPHLDAPAMLPDLHHRIAYALIACALGAAGCGGGDRATAAITPSIRLSRNVVPLGGPVDATLQFYVPPNTAPFSEDDRVLLDLTFDDGELMGAYDHDPPAPTRTWKAGSTVTYTRRLFVPALPYVGDAPIVVGLYSPASGRRLRLSGKDEGGRTYKVGALTLRPAQYLWSFEDGWYPAEGVPATQTEWRWSQPEASIMIDNPRQDAVLYLRLAGRPDLFKTPQQVALTRGNRLLRQFPVTSTDPMDHELALTPDDFGTDERVKLTFKIDQTFVPARVGQGADTRVLGIRAYNVFLEARPSR